MIVYRGFNIIALTAMVLFASKPDISITGTVTDGKDPQGGRCEGYVLSMGRAGFPEPNNIFSYIPGNFSL